MPRRSSLSKLPAPTTCIDPASTAQAGEPGRSRRDTGQRRELSHTRALACVSRYTHATQELWQCAHDSGCKRTNSRATRRAAVIIFAWLSTVYRLVAPAPSRCWRRCDALLLPIRCTIGRSSLHVFLVRYYDPIERAATPTVPRHIANKLVGQ